MDHSIEAYLRRMDIHTLRVVCELPETQVPENVKTLAREILAQRQKTEAPE